VDKTRSTENLVNVKVACHSVEFDNNCFGFLLQALIITYKKEPGIMINSEAVEKGSREGLLSRLFQVFAFFYWI